MVTQVTKLGGTASNVTVGRVSVSMPILLRKRRNRDSTSDEQCFESIKAGVDALPPGTKMFLNSGEFYSPTLGPENVELLSRFYAKYPEYADKTFLSVKGAVRDRLEPDSSMENLRKSVSNILRALGPHKKLDLFEPARVDSSIPIEQTMENLVVLVKEGHFAHIGLSECSAETLRKANVVYPVTAAEIEVSVWEYNEEQKKVIATAGELGIAVIAYSQSLGKGFLTGKITSPSDVPANDWRAHLTRFQEANMAHNMAILSIAWVASLGQHVIPLPGSSKATRTLENCAAGDIVLSAEEAADITAIAEKADVKGDRYFGGKELNHLWG
ncbi:aldo/keto reductase [Mycena sp. CBHHK59/15]|nr:aldo/keto reductase [Mycena sp. CBHHK59/15]